MIQIQNDWRGQLRSLLFPERILTNKQEILEQFQEFLKHYIAIGQLGEFKSTKTAQNILMSSLFFIWNGQQEQANNFFVKYQLICKLTEEIQIIEDFKDLVEIVAILQEFCEWEWIIQNLSQKVDFKNNTHDDLWNFNSANYQFVQYYQKFQPKEIGLQYKYQILTYKEDLQLYLNQQKPELSNVSLFDQYFSIIQSKPYLFLQYYQQLNQVQQNQILKDKVYGYINQYRNEKYNNLVAFMEILVILQKFDILNSMFELIIHKKSSDKFNEVMKFFQLLYPLKNHKFEYSVRIDKVDSYSRANKILYFYNQQSDELLIQIQKFLLKKVITPPQTNRISGIKQILQQDKYSPRVVQQFLPFDFVLASNEDQKQCNFQIIKNTKHKELRQLIVQMARQSMYSLSDTIIIFYRFLKNQDQIKEFRQLQRQFQKGFQEENLLLDILIEYRVQGQEQQNLNSLQQLLIHFNLVRYTDLIKDVSQKLENRLSILNAQVQMPIQAMNRIILLNTPINKFMKQNPNFFNNQQIQVLRNFHQVQIVDNIHQTSECTAIYNNTEYHLVRSKINAESLIILLTAQSQQYNILHKLQHLSFDNNQNMLLLFNKLDVLDYQKNPLNIARALEYVFKVNKYSDITLDDIKMEKQQVVITNYWYKSQKEFDPIKLVKSYLKSLPFKDKHANRIINDTKYQFQNIAQLVKYCELMIDN
ncbi:hypothetical protein pb186bvf_002604 [Paramecium bursaria]